MTGHDAERTGMGETIRAVLHRHRFVIVLAGLAGFLRHYCKRHELGDTGIGTYRAQETIGHLPASERLRDGGHQRGEQYRHACA